MTSLGVEDGFTMSLKMHQAASHGKCTWGRTIIVPELPLQLSDPCVFLCACLYVQALRQYFSCFFPVQVCLGSVAAHSIGSLKEAMGCGAVSRKLEMFFRDLQQCIGEKEEPSTILTE